MVAIITQDGIKVPVGTHEGKLIVLASDHRGVHLKEGLKEHLDDAGCRYYDVGAYSDERTDYPPWSDAAGFYMSRGEEFGVVGIGICGSGIGMLIPASKHRGVYGGLCRTVDEAVTSRKHNNTNFLSLGADSTSLEQALAIVNAWLTTKFYSDPEKERPYLERFVQTVRLEAIARKAF